MAKRRKKSRRREGEAREVPERVEAWDSGEQRLKWPTSGAPEGGRGRGTRQKEGLSEGEPPKPTPEPKIPSPLRQDLSLILFIQLIPLEKRRTPSGSDSVAVVFPPSWPEVPLDLHFHYSIEFSFFRFGTLGVLDLASMKSIKRDEWPGDDVPRSGSFLLSIAPRRTLETRYPYRIR